MRSVFFLGLTFLTMSAFAQTGSIGGTVFNDVNGNGVNDSESGIENVTVFLDLDNDGQFDGGEPSTLTGVTGTFDFVGLTAGTYFVQVDPSLAVGFGPTTATIPLTINLSAGQDVNDADFGFGLENPSVGVAKDENHAGRQVELIFYLENLGNVDIQNVVLQDDLDAVFGAGNYIIFDPPSWVVNPGGLTLNPSYNGSGDINLVQPGGTLAWEASGSLRMVVELTTISDQGFGSGTYQNQVTLAGESAAGTMVADLSDFGTDPDPNGNGVASDAGEDDPTVIALLENPRIGVAKSALVSGSQVTLDFYLEAFGNVVSTNLSLVDNLNTTFGAGNFSIVSPPVLIDDPGTIVLNGGFNGSGDTELISSGSLFLFDTAQIRVVVDVTNVTDQGLGVGVYDNQATASAQSPNGTSTSDLSDQGFNPDPNGDDNPSGLNEADPTRIVIGEEPVIGLAKDATVAGSIVSVDFYLENLGNVTLEDLSLVDDLNSAFGAGNFFVSAGPVLVDDPGTITLNAGYDGNFQTELLNPGASTLTAGDTARIQIDVTILALSDQGFGTGVYQNTAQASAAAPGGAVTLDTSDSGTDPDPNGNGIPNEAGENDPTAINVTPNAAIGVSKEFVSGGLSGGNPVVFLYITVENVGNQTLSSITVTDDLDAVYGAGNYTHTLDPEFVTGTPALTYNAGYNGSASTTMVTSGTLAPGEFTTFRVSHTVTTLTDQGFGVGIYENQATAEGLDPGANPVTDLSDEGTDPDPNNNGDAGEAGEDDPTVINLSGTESVGLAKAASVTGNVVTLDIYVENLGTVGLQSMSLPDNLDAVFGAGNYTITTPPFLVDDPGTLTLAVDYDGSTQFDLLDVGSSTLAAGATAQIQLEVTVDPITNQGLGIGQYLNQATILAISNFGGLVSDASDSGTDPDPNGNGNANEAGENDPTAITIAVDSPIGVAKQASILGNVVTLNLYLENLGAGTLSNLSLVDDLDATFGAGNYTITAAPSLVVDPGTLVLNGGYDGGGDADILSATSTLNGGATAQITLEVRVDIESDQGNGSGPNDGYGVYVNQAIAAGDQTNGVRVSDRSDDGTDPDPNGNGDPSEAGEEDPTSIVISVSPVIGLSKSAFVNGTQVTFDFFVENLGESTLHAVELRDPLNPVLGSGNYSIQQQPFLVSGATGLNLSPQYFGFNIFDRVVVEGFIRPGEVAHIRTVVNVNTVSDQGDGFGVYFNQATISALAPDGSPVNDTSHNGTDPDPDGNGTPDEMDTTPFTIGDEGRIGAAKTATVVGTQVTFDIYLENFGGNAMNSLLVTENLDTVFGAGNYSLNGVPTFIVDPGTLNINAGFDGSGDTALLGAGSSLNATTTAQIRLVVDVNNVVDVGFGVGNYRNQVTFEGTTPLGGPAFDLSDSGSDPDPSGNGLANDANEGDPTIFFIGSPSIGVAKNATINGRQVTFDYYVENLGDTVFSSVSLPDNFDSVFGAGNYTIISGPDIVSAPRDFVVNTNFDGSSNTELIAAGGISPGVTEQIQVVVQVGNLVDMGSGFGVYSNQVTVDADGLTDLSDAGTNPDPNGNTLANDAGEDDPTPVIVPQDALIGSAKTVAVNTRTVTVDIYLESLANVAASNVSVIEDLDALFGAGNYSVTSAPSLIVTPGTLTVNAGFDGSGSQDLLGPGSTMAIGDTAQIRFVVEVTTVTDQGSGFGIYPNQVTSSAHSPNMTLATDTSDSGLNPDPDGDGNPDEAGENDPTVITLRGTLGDFVWDDINGDGIQDGGEPGLENVVVFLDANSNGVLDGGESSQTTDANGAYDFTDLPAGNYTVAVDLSTVPGNYNLTTANLPLAVAFQPGEDLNTADFGFQQQDATIGDFVWNDLDGDGVQDAGEPGLSGVTVYLDLNSNTTLDGGEPFDTTDANGAYDITDLGTNNYVVTVDASTVPVGFVQTGGTDPLAVMLAAGEDYNTADFGYQQQDATIGNFVWDDLDGNGVQDAGEPGIDGVTVFLDLNTNGALDGGEPNAATAGGGFYLFSDLATGTYAVTVDASTVPVGYGLTGGSTPQVVNLAAGEDYTDADFGYQQQDATIGDFVWNDLNGDGVQDGGEPGLAGVTVFLDLNANGVLDGGEPFAVTDANGLYDITDLPLGNYAVRPDASTVPAGYVLTGGTVPQAVNLAAGEDYNTADFGFQRQDGLIGDFIWNDYDGDGVQDAGEPGLANVTVDLIDDLNGNGALDGGEPVLATDTTDAAGNYGFTGLSLGNYLVAVTDTNSVLVGFVQTAGGNPMPVSLIKGQSDPTIDLGYQRVDHTLGGLVWHDYDADGVQDAGEPPFANVTIDLYTDVNGDGLLDGGDVAGPSTVTDANGNYTFSNLPPGNFLVNVTDTNNVLTNLTLINGPNPRPVMIVDNVDVTDADFAYLDARARIGVSLDAQVTQIVPTTKTNQKTFHQYIVDFTIQVQNFGTVQLTNLSLQEDLDAVFFNTTFFLSEPLAVAGGNAASADVNPNFDGVGDTEVFAAGSVLDPGELIIMTFQVTLPDPPEINGVVSYTNQVTVTALGPSGNPVIDDSTDGLDPDGNNNNDPGDDNTATLIVLPLPIPTLGEWALIIFVTLLAGMALVVQRRQRQRQTN